VSSFCTSDGVNLSYVEDGQVTRLSLSTVTPPRRRPGR
jgi:hypothetical protein